MVSSAAILGGEVAGKAAGKAAENPANTLIILGVVGLAAYLLLPKVIGLPAEILKDAVGEVGELAKEQAEAVAEVAGLAIEGSGDFFSGFLGGAEPVRRSVHVAERHIAGDKSSTIRRDAPEDRIIGQGIRTLVEPSPFGITGPTHTTLVRRGDTGAVTVEVTNPSWNVPGADFFLVDFEDPSLARKIGAKVGGFLDPTDIPGDFVGGLKKIGGFFF